MSIPWSGIGLAVGLWATASGSCGGSGAALPRGLLEFLLSLALWLLLVFPSLSQLSVSLFLPCVPLLVPLLSPWLLFLWLLFLLFLLWLFLWFLRLWFVLR